MIILLDNAEVSMYYGQFPYCETSLKIHDNQANYDESLHSVLTKSILTILCLFME